MMFEMVGGYTDSLLEQMELKSHPKGRWMDLVEPCTARDLGRLREEMWGCMIRMRGEGRERHCGN